MAITAVTRRALFAELRDTRWWGDCRDEVEFMGRLYDLDALPSADPKYDSARSDMIQHRVRNPEDWDDLDLFGDARFQLSTGDDEPLLRFLTEMIHPEVRMNRDEVRELVDVYNTHLCPDGWELFVERKISSRPVFGWRAVTAPEVSPEQLRTAIAEAIASNVKAQNVEALCVRIGLAPSAGDHDDPFTSKRAYVRRRINTKNRSEMIDIAERVQDELKDLELGTILDDTRADQPADSKLSLPRQLLFAAVGVKPELVLADAISNDIELVKNADNCLHYDRPIGDSGLTWRQLVRWWPHDTDANEHTRARALHRRLQQSLDEGPEQLILHTYAKLYGEIGFDIPALLPQVYVHYDPYSQRRNRRSPLPRQRMDFLLLVSGRRRIVIELDGRQHYANDDGMASPSRYAEMVSADRKLKLSGYEVFRIGGHEASGSDAEALLREFFIELLRAFDVTVGE